jgi:hypothetical protein
VDDGDERVAAKGARCSLLRGRREHEDGVAAGRDEASDDFTVVADVPERKEKKGAARKRSERARFELSRVEA